MTRVLRTTRGYQIIKLESATETKVKTMDEARAEIADNVAQQKQRGQMRQYLQHLRSAGDHRLEERRSEEGVRGRRQAAEPTAAHRAMTPEWFAIWTRSRHEKAGARSARAEARRSLPADDHQVEPLEGPQEADRLAAVSRLLLRALRRHRAAADPEVRRRRHHRRHRRHPVAHSGDRNRRASAS